MTVSAYFSFSRSALADVFDKNEKKHKTTPSVYRLTGLNKLIKKKLSKGLCHEDIAVLGQFFAGVVVWCVSHTSSYTKCRRRGHTQKASKLNQVEENYMLTGLRTVPL